MSGVSRVVPTRVHRAVSPETPELADSCAPIRKPLRGEQPCDAGTTRGKEPTIDQAKRTLKFWAWAAVAGIVSAAVFLAVAELVALARRAEGSPILAVGSFVIDIVPQPFKEFAIATFGEYDKIALLVGLGLAVLVASAITGIAAVHAAAARRRRARSSPAGCRSPRSSRAPARRRSRRFPPIAGTVAGCLVLIVPRRAAAPAGRRRADRRRRRAAACRTRSRA